MRDLFEASSDATLLDPNECDGLIPSHIVLRSELNEYEQANILRAEMFARARNRDPLSEAFGKRLHKRMFEQVWKWAGTYRRTNKNIGVDYPEIVPRLYQLFDDVRYQIGASVYAPDEIAARLHHGLVFVHPFPNGNGRWSRMMSDILLRRMGRPEFTFGRGLAGTTTDLRQGYVAALRMADAHDFTALLAFLRA